MLTHIVTLGNAWKPTATCSQKIQERQKRENRHESKVLIVTLNESKVLTATSGKRVFKILSTVSLKCSNNN